MATQAAQPENHCPLTTTLGVSPWIRKLRPGDCQRWKGLQGAFGVLSGGILGGLVRYWGAGVVLSLARHSPSGPPGTHGQHHYKTLPFRCTSNLSPPGGALAPVENQ